MKFLSPEIALYLYKSTMGPCMEYSCHVWAGAPNCYLELLDQLQNEYAGLLVQLQNEYAGLLVLHLLLLLNPWLIIEM